MPRAWWQPRTAAVLAALAALSACTVGPDFKRPTPQLPTQWSRQARSVSADVDTQTVSLAQWWRGFADPQLDSLITRAARDNLELHAAVLRIDEARAQRAVASAAGWPSVTAQAAYSRTRLSETTPTGSLFSSVSKLQLPGLGGFSIPNPYNQYEAAAAISWEPDLFGRIRRSVEAADATLQVQIEDQRAVRLALLADVAQSYLALRSAQAHLTVANDSVATMHELLELAQQRRAGGLTSEIDVSDAQAEVTLMQASLPLYAEQVTQGINQLSQLLGLPPEALRDELEPAAALPSASTLLPVGVPADLARRRPDIREAEAQLHAATAQVGVAVANLFPRLSLSASGGMQSETAAGLADWSSRFGTLGPTLSIPVFDRGAWKSIALQDVRAQQAALTYQRTVLGALHEVENALAVYGADQGRRMALQDTVLHNRDALAMSRQRYEGGLISLIGVLDAERTLHQNEASLIDVEVAVADDAVTLYRALGGGWDDAATG